MEESCPSRASSSRMRAFRAWFSACSAANCCSNDAWARAGTRAQRAGGGGSGCSSMALVYRVVAYEANVSRLLPGKVSGYRVMTSANSRKSWTTRSGGYFALPNGRRRRFTKAVRMPNAFAPTQSKP